MGRYSAYLNGLCYSWAYENRVPGRTYQERCMMTDAWHCAREQNKSAAEFGVTSATEEGAEWEVLSASDCRNSEMNVDDDRGDDDDDRGELEEYEVRDGLV